ITGPATIATSLCAPYTLNAFDSTGKPLILASTTTFALSVKFNTGKLYSDPKCSASITTVTMLAGASTVKYYYLDSKSNTQTASGTIGNTKVSASLAVTVTSVQTLTFSSASQNLGALTRFWST